MKHLLDTGCMLLTHASMRRGANCREERWNVVRHLLLFECAGESDARLLKAPAKGENQVTAPFCALQNYHLRRKPLCCVTGHDSSWFEDVYD